MQHILQKGLSAGLSATSGFHSKKPTAVPEDHDGFQDLTSSDFIPTRDTRETYHGKTGNVEIPRIAIGAWPWGDKATWDWKPEELDGVKEAWAICQRNGLNFIDTAQVYGTGESERICGQLVSGMKREDFIMQTKYWVLPADPTNIAHPKDAPLIMLKQSLERMKLDYIDVYMVHGHIHAQSIATIAKSIADCVDQGLTKTVAVANYSASDMLQMKDELAKYGVPLAANQCEYSILRREPEVSGLIKACHDNGIVFQCYSSLAQGRLSGKYSADNPPPERYRFSSYKMEDIEPTIETVRQIAQKRGKPVSAVALNYNLVHGLTPVVGIRNPEQAEQNSQAFGWRLSEDEIKAIDDVSIKGKKTALWQQG